MCVLRKMRKVGCPYHGEQPVDGHSSLLGFHVRHVILDHLVRDAMRELVAQLNDPAGGEKPFKSHVLLHPKPNPISTAVRTEESDKSNSGQK